MWKHAIASVLGSTERQKRVCTYECRMSSVTSFSTRVSRPLGAPAEDEDEANVDVDVDDDEDDEEVDDELEEVAAVAAVAAAATAASNVMPAHFGPVMSVWVHLMKSNGVTHVNEYSIASSSTSSKRYVRSIS